MNFVIQAIILHVKWYSDIKAMKFCLVFFEKGQWSLFLVLRNLFSVWCPYGFTLLQEKKYLKRQKSRQVWPCPELQQLYDKGELVRWLALKLAQEGFKISYFSDTSHLYLGHKNLCSKGLAICSQSHFLPYHFRGTPEMRQEVGMGGALMGPGQIWTSAVSLGAWAAGFTTVGELLSLFHF